MHIEDLECKGISPLKDGVNKDKSSNQIKEIKRDTTNTVFQGTLDQIFFSKGVYFEKTRIFGTVSVRIVDLAALELAIHNGIGLSPGLMRAKSKRNFQGKQPHPPRKKHSKRRNSVRRRHSVRSGTDLTSAQKT